MAVAFDAREPCLRALLGFGGVAAPVDGEPAVGSGADAGVIVPAPVNEIVPALGAGPRVVGNFVGRKTRGGADRLREIVEVAPQTSSGSASLPALCRPKNGVSGSIVS